jgi:hypothetical protein
MPLQSSKILILLFEQVKPQVPPVQVLFVFGYEGQIFPQPPQLKISPRVSIQPLPHRVSPEGQRSSGGFGTVVRTIAGAIVLTAAATGRAILAEPLAGTGRFVSRSICTAIAIARITTTTATPAYRIIFFGIPGAAVPEPGRFSSSPISSATCY